MKLYNHMEEKRGDQEGTPILSAELCHWQITLNINSINISRRFFSYKPSLAKHTDSGLQCTFTR